MLVEQGHIQYKRSDFIICRSYFINTIVKVFENDFGKTYGF